MNNKKKPGEPLETEGRVMDNKDDKNEELLNKQLQLLAEEVLERKCGYFSKPYRCHV